MSYKSTLPYATPMLIQEQKYVRLQWTIQHKDDDSSRTIFIDETCFAIPFVDGHETQVLKSNKFPKTNRRLWCRKASAPRISLVIIPLKQLCMSPTTFKFFKIISFIMQEENLVDDGDCNRIMILNMKVD